MAEAVLEGCFVRLKRGSTHMLRRVLAARLPPPGAPHDQLKLAVEGVPAPISWRKLSDADPLHDGTQYDASGRAELRALQVRRPGSVQGDSVRGDSVCCILMHWLRSLGAGSPACLPMAACPPASHHHPHRRMQEELAAAGRPRGVPLAATAGGSSSPPKELAPAPVGHQDAPGCTRDVRQPVQRCRHQRFFTLHAHLQRRPGGARWRCPGLSGWRS